MRSSAIPIPTEEQKRVFEHESLKILNLHCVLKELNTTFDFLKKCLLQLHQPIPTLSTKKEDIIVKIFKMSCVVYNIQFPIVAPLPQITFAERVIAEEDKSKPLPDEDLAAMLKEKGFPIARRTIAKYREQLDIPVARLRKKM